MKIRRSILAVVTAAVVAGCGTGVPDLGALESDLGGLLSSPAPAGPGTGTSGGNQGNAGPSSAGPTAPPAGPAGTIRGTITFHTSGRTEDPIDHHVVEHDQDATIEVRLVRDPSSEDELYVDDGSTYSTSQLITTEVQIPACGLATSELKAEAEHAFADRPTSYENSIEAVVRREEGLVLISALYSWTYTLTGNACDGRAPFTGENSGGLACPFLGLMAKLIEGSGQDQIDATCVLPGGETYAGVLTLTR